MSLYLDSSAATKVHVQESGSDEVSLLVRDHGRAAVSTIGRVEIASAIGRAVRANVLERGQGRLALESLDAAWATYFRLPVTENLVERAAEYAWAFDLRAYDAVHLAAAMAFRRIVEEQVTFACFDRKLWLAARDAGLEAWPPRLG